MAARAIELEWQGETYVIPENETFEVAEQIEDVIDLGDFEELQRKPKMTKIARCYGIMLRHAGATVSDGEIHQEILRGALTGDQKAEQVFAAMSLITHFLTAGMPFDEMQAGEGVKAQDGGDKKKAPNSSKTASRSLSKSTKSRRQSSGK